MFNVSSRCQGEIYESGFVKITKLLSYDFVASPSFGSATFKITLDRKIICNNWKEKINKLKNT